MHGNDRKDSARRVKSQQPDSKARDSPDDDGPLCEGDHTYPEGMPGLRCRQWYLDKFGITERTWTKWVDSGKLKVSKMGTAYQWAKESGVASLFDTWDE